MLDPGALERRFLAEHPAPAKPLPAARKPALSEFQLAIAIMIAIAALAVVIAAVRMTDRGIYRAVEEREAPERFLANELAPLRFMAMSATSGIPGRLYLGIEECFKARVAMPFSADDLALGRQTLATCADMEIGRLEAQGGAAMAERGRAVLRDAGIPLLSSPGLASNR
jgi:hypothetical protein